MDFVTGRGKRRSVIMTVPGPLYAKGSVEEQVAVRGYIFGQESPLAQPVPVDGGTTFIQPAA